MNNAASHVAAAQAMTRAGNFAAARRHIDDALALRPRDVAAKRARVDLEITRGEPWAALNFAEDWLESDPNGLHAHFAHFESLVATSSQHLAKQKLETLAGLFANRPEVFGELELRYAAKFGSPRETLRMITAHRERFGNQTWLDEYQLMACYQAGESVLALQTGAKLLAAAPQLIGVHRYIAVAAYRTGQFALARRHARAFNLARPQFAAIGREIIVSSWLVWFPPFLAAHVAVKLVRLAVKFESRFSPLLRIWVKTFALVIIIFWFYFSEIAAVQIIALGLLFWSTFLLFVYWFCYEYFVFPNSSKVSGRRREQLRLSSDY